MSRRQNPLGRDLFDIFSDNLPEEKKKAAEMLRITDIEPRKDQPRKVFDREALQTLADSISTYGVLQPIIVRANETLPNLYELIAGERRWRAASMAGLTEIPAVVLEGDDLKIAQISLIENIQREDLNPVEEAMAYEALIDKFDLTQEQVAKQVGKSRPAIANMLRLLELPEEVLIMLRDKEISAGHARAILGLNDEENMAILAHRAVDNDMSVREVEAAVKRMNDAARRSENESEKTDPQVKIHMRELEHKATSALGRRVRISRSSHKKVVELSYNDDADLEALLMSLCGATIFDEN